MLATHTCWSLNQADCWNVKMFHWSLSLHFLQFLSTWVDVCELWWVSGELPATTNSYSLPVSLLLPVQSKWLQRRVLVMFSMIIGSILLNAERDQTMKMVMEPTTLLSFFVLSFEMIQIISMPMTSALHLHWQLCIWGSQEHKPSWRVAMRVSKTSLHQLFTLEIMLVEELSTCELTTRKHLVTLVNRISVWRHFWK